MREYIICKIDGEPDWHTVPAIPVDCVLWEPDCGIRMTQQICYDETALYIRQQAREAQIRAAYSVLHDPVHEDSCMEFFFALGNDNRYFNFEINPNACFEIGFGPDRHHRVHLCGKRDQKHFQAHCTRISDGWTAEYRLPLEFLRLFYPAFRLESGVSFRANCYKCGDKTEHPHFLSWNPVASGTPDFHRPQDFGSMQFA